jgi:hypothetical protein
VNRSTSAIFFFPHNGCCQNILMETVVSVHVSYVLNQDCDIYMMLVMSQTLSSKGLIFTSANSESGLVVCFGRSPVR